VAGSETVSVEYAVPPDGVTLAGLRDSWKFGSSEVAVKEATSLKLLMLDTDIVDVADDPALKDTLPGFDPRLKPG